METETGPAAEPTAEEQTIDELNDEAEVSEVASDDAAPLAEGEDAATDLEEDVADDQLAEDDE